MRLDVALIASQLGPVSHGLLITVELWALSMVASVTLGMALALLRHHAGPLLAMPLRAMVEVVRGTPFLIQLFLLYYGGPSIGLTLNEYVAGLVALSLYGGCYMSEVFRAGLQSVPVGHVEAASSVGLTGPQTFWRVVLPEMTALVLPPLVNVAVALLKHTAVLSIITVPELTFEANSLGSQYFAFAEALLLLSLCYWALVEAISAAGRRLEGSLSRLRVT